jgi:hypothetical protein
MAAATGLVTDLACALDASRLMQRCGWPPDPWQQAVLRSTAPRSLLNCCRQSGKSLTCACLALHTALYRPESLILLLSPSLRQSQELFLKVLAAVRAFGLPAPFQAESALRCALTNGSRIVSLPGTEGTVRGYSGVYLLIIDEAARVADELYYAVTPMLAVSHGRLLALSTPWGQRGWYFQEWQYGQGWARVQVPASDCPRISPDFLAQERATMPLVHYEAEYLCRFTQTTQHVFREEDIRAMLDPTVEPWTFLPRGVA